MMLEPLMPEGARSHIPAFVQSLTSVVVAIMDAEGTLLEANAGFLLLANVNEAPEPRWNIRHLFIQPDFPDLKAAASDTDQGALYEGIINIGEVHTGCRSVKGAIYRYQQQWLLVAEHDISGLEKLNAAVIALNDELADTQRALIKANRELQRKEKEITALMLSDPLTGIANRRSFDLRIKEEIERHHRYGHPLCLAIGDIDHFKKVNDSFGHDIGDEVICRFAHTLRDHKRSSDFVARIGGEEFMLILAETSADQAWVIVNRLRQVFESQTYTAIDRPITASFGLSELQLNDDYASLIKRADLGLYQSKEKGRNQVTLQAPTSTSASTS